MDEEANKGEDGDRENPCSPQQPKRKHPGLHVAFEKWHPEYLGELMNNIGPTLRAFSHS
jgi:hypothetical protein